MVNLKLEIISLQNFLDKNLFLNLRFVNKNDLVQKIPLSSGILNHIYYFFNYLDLEYTYYHTKNEKELRQILEIPMIVTIVSLSFKVLIFFVILYIILKPIFGLICGLFLAFKIDKKWEIFHWSIKYIIFFLILFFICIMCDKQNIISSFEESKPLGIFLIILYAVLLYTFLIVVCKGLLLSIVCGLIGKGKKFVGELEILKFIKRFLEKLGSLFASSISFIFFLVFKIIPHLKYQYFPEGEIIDAPDRKEEILDSADMKGCNGADFVIYELPDDYYLIINTKNKSRFTSKSTKFTKLD